MNLLEQQLCNPELTGSYSLDCSIDELNEAVASAGFAIFEVDLKGVKGKQQLFNEVAQAVNFPPEFGANWDALADALCDLSWCAASGYVLLLKNVSETFGLSANDREIALDLLADTVVYWRQRNKSFWIFYS